MGWKEETKALSLTKEQIAPMTIRELLDIKPEVRRYLMARNPDI